jgi:mycofactocin precursor
VSLPRETGFNVAPVSPRQLMCDSLMMSPTLTLPAPPPVAEDVLDTETSNGTDVSNDALVEESLVEEVSIDGMCGVY